MGYFKNKNSSLESKLICKPIKPPPISDNSWSPKITTNDGEKIVLSPYNIAISDSTNCNTGNSSNSSNNTDEESWKCYVNNSKIDSISGMLELRKRWNFTIYGFKDIFKLVIK